MKIKFTLTGSGRQPVDLLATVDASATVGDLAEFLHAADPSQRSTQGLASHEDLTLGLVGANTVALDSRLAVADSGLHSGSTVTLSRSGQAFRDPNADADAIVTITEGSDEGRTFNVHRGTNIIGRAVGCEVRLTDPLVSRQHIRLNITDVAEVVDLGSANGVSVEDAIVTRIVLRPGDTVRVGDTALTVKMTQRAQSTTKAVDTTVAFVRSPRLDPHYEGREFKFPEPPERPTPARFPVVALLAPLLVGALLYLVTKSPTALLFVALSPLMLVGNAVESRISGRSAFKKALAQWHLDVDDVLSEVKEEQEAEVIGRNLEHPSLATTIEAALQTSPLLWTRRPGEPGFLELRLGVGRQPTRSSFKLPEPANAPRELMTELLEQTQPLAIVADVPVVAEPGAHGAVGFAGERSLTLAVARGYVVQAAVLHSPSELVIAAFASSDSAKDWEWLKWLPHTTSPHSPLPVRHLAATAMAGSSLVSELEEIVALREDHDGISLPAILVVVESDAPVEHSRLVQLAERGWTSGVVVAWIAPSVATLPAACRTFVEVDSTSSAGSVGFVHNGEHVEPLTLETVDGHAAMDLARKMAPLVDIGARVDDESDLPRSVSLLALTGPSLATSADAVLERWNESRSIITGPCAPPTPPRYAGSLRAIIGQSAGEPLAVDLRTDGPHALVGGTTGSGKSELLQAWILALAAAHSPQRLTFLLVDYKGGSAFRDCTELPHTIGLVTDLSPHLVRRALTSLSAELRYREHLLAQYGAKDLMTLEKQGVAEAPPSLVIVVDEFAALVKEVPEFVDGVVDVAQRGRSLGLHLVLATQRPAGVIKDNLRANTNLRLALRMADEADSTDVLGSPQAAYFDQSIPGRAVSKTGPGRLVPFQTAYAGGWTTDAAPPPEMLVEELVFGAGTAWEPAEGVEAAIAEEGETDIKRLVACVNAANARAEIKAPRKPWLPELKSLYDLADQEAVPTRRSDTELVFGVRDDPDNQTQPTVAFRPDRDGNLVVYGTGGSGKSTLLRTLAIAAGFTVRGGPCHVYGIDFGVRGLSMLEDLPHVGSIIDGSDHERIVRLLRWLRSTIDERASRYSNANAATITDYRRLAGAPDEPRVLLLVDGIAAFRQAYEPSDRIRWFELFTSLAADGRPVGVHVILSSDQRSGMTTSLASAVQSRVVLRLASEDEYGMLNVPADVLTASSPAGRGLFGEGEVQVAVLGGTGDVVSQAVATRGFADAMRRAGASIAAPIQRLPEIIPLRALDSSTVEGPVIGLSSDSLGPVSIQPRGTFVVSGPPGSGRTTTLRSLLEALKAWNPRVRLCYFGNRRSPLAELADWSTRAVGAADIAESASSLAAAISAGTPGGPPLAVFIEGIGEYAGGPADGPLEELVKACLAEDHFVVIEGETSTLTASFGVLGAAKSSRAGLALSPDQSDGTTVYRTNFPRTNRAEFPPGRALLVGLGKTEVVQIGVPD